MRNAYYSESEIRDIMKKDLKLGIISPAETYHKLLALNYSDARATEIINFWTANSTFWKTGYTPNELTYYD